MLKSRLKNNEQTIGSWVTLAHPLVPELLAHGGYDWLCVDLEHSSIELGDLLPLLISIEAKGMVPLVRVGENDANLIKRVMDAGAHGVIVANVRTPDEAKRAVSAVKYPPKGRRGVGLYRAQDYGRRFDDYIRWMEDESVVIVQIEHIDAVEHIDDILSVDGVDAFMIGPYDLSGSLGMPGKLDAPEVSGAVERVLEAGRRLGVPAGYHAVQPQPDLARSCMERGFRFLAYSTDAILLSTAAAKSMEGLR